MQYCQTECQIKQHFSQKYNVLELSVKKCNVLKFTGFKHIFDVIFLTIGCLKLNSRDIIKHVSEIQCKKASSTERRGELGT